MSKTLTLCKEKDEDWRTIDLGKKRPDKSVCVVRYGGFGDALQTASVIYEYKELGYYVAVNCSESTSDILSSDPNVDEIIIQPTDLIPNQDLGEFWYYLSQKFNKFVNLSESVEGSLLATPNRITYLWPQAVRHRYMDHNYIEFMHGIADVPFTTPHVKFYPTKKERRWAVDQLKKYRLGGYKVVMWVLAGSSIHKVYPYVDNVIAKIMLDNPKTRVILVGEYDCKLLEQGWQDEGRVICKSGEWSIRETISIAQLCDVVIGPETGVINSVSQENNVIKVVFLSHSSINNLTRDWVKTINIVPTCECYPCHKLHYGTSSCNLHPELGIAVCVETQTPYIVYDAIKDYL